MNINLCVFDLAGTTIKDDGGIVNKYFREAFFKYGFEFNANQINKFMGMPKPLAIEKLLNKHYDTASLGYYNERIHKIHQTFIELMIDYYRDNKNVAEIIGTSDIFYYLKDKGIKVAIDTGFSADITETIIDRMKWIKNGLVDAVISSDEVPNGRPHPDMIYALMHQTSTPSSKTVAKIGDTPSDLEEGIAADCGLILGVTQGSHTEEQLISHAQLPNTWLIPNINFIKNIL